MARLLNIGRKAQTTAGAVDDALLSGLRAGDADAFERLYLDFAGSMYNVCLRILRSPEDAEDVTQEVFIKAYRRLPGCADEFRLKAWLNRVAVNACYDHLRSRRSRADLDTATDVPGTPRLDSFQQAELSQTLEQTLGSLSLDHRIVLLLKDVQGLTQKEIAGVLGVSTSATEARLSRAREAFRRAYSELTRPWQRARCDLAGQAAVDAVGRGLSERQRRRLLRHAESCPDCGDKVKGWGATTVGLAVLLPSVPLPAGLLASPFAALGIGAAGVAGVGAAAGGIGGGGLAVAGATGAGAVGAGATGVVTGVAATAAGALAAKVVVVVIVAGALAGTAGLAAQRDTSSYAHDRAGTRAESRGPAGDPPAAQISADHVIGKGHQASAGGRSGRIAGAKAKRQVAAAGRTSPDKMSRGLGKGVGKGKGVVARSVAVDAHGKSGSAGRSTASAGASSRSSSSKGTTGVQAGAKAHGGGQPAVGKPAVGKPAVGKPAVGKPSGDKPQQP